MTVLCLIYIVLYFSSADLLYKNLICSVLPLYTFFYFFYKDALTEKDFERFTLLFVIVLLIVYRNNQLVYLEEDRTDDVLQMTNNAGMKVITMLPMVLLIKRPILRYIVLGVTLTLVLFSMKRGAMLIAAVLLIIFFLSNTSDTPKSGIKKVLLSVAVIGGLYYAVTYLLRNNDYFVFRLENTLAGDDSERSSMWRMARFVFVWKFSPLEQLFGRGPNGFSSIAGTGAHNDWYEFLLDFGIIGVLIYLVYWIQFILTWIRARKLLGKKNKIIIVLSMLIISIFLRTLFSFSFLNLFFIDTCLLGYCLAEISKTYRIA